jgi:NAD(P)-dependent dehydrogenase (short-subunit alcohol dehydrogenase family)
MVQFTGKVALITGGSTGIGFATAKEFAKLGAKVVITSRGKKAGEEALASLKAMKADALWVGCDVQKSADVKRVVDMTIEKYGQLDCCFNNAGVIGNLAPVSIQDLKESDWHDVIETNLSGTYHAFKYELDYFVKAKRKGAIVVTSSIAGNEYQLAGWFPYFVSKVAVKEMVKHVANEYGEKGIRCNAVQPGLLDDGVVTKAGSATPGLDVWLKGEAEKTPLRALVTSEQVAKAVVWLCSDEAEMVTGASIVIDGGYTLGR